MNKLAKKPQLNESKIPENIFENGLVTDSISETTKQAYNSDINQFNTYLDMTSQTLSIDSVKSYFRSIKEKYQPSTINRKKQALLRAFREMYQNNPLAKSVIEKVVKENTPTYKVDQTVTEDQILSPEQVQELRELSRKPLSLIIQFLWLTACRISELVSIRVNRDVKQINGFVQIQLVGKGNKTRKVKIPTDFYKELKATFKGNKYLFETRTGNKYDQTNIYKQLQRVGNKINPDMPVNPHIFRHSRATYLLKHGFTLKAVSQFLGHSSTAITADIYINDSIDYNEMYELDKKQKQDFEKE